MDLRRIAAGFFSLLIVGLVLGGLSPARTQAAPEVWSPTWHSVTVDNGNNDVGSHSSIAFSPVDHHPYVSYYEAQTGYLKMATYSDGYGVSCNAGWSCFNLDGGTNSQTGAENSLVFDAAGTAWIGYTDPSYSWAKLLRLDTNFNKTISVLRGDSGPSSNPPGADEMRFPSITMWNGHPIVAAYEKFDGTKGIWTFLRLLSTDSWYLDVEVVPADVTLGYYASLDYNLMTGRPTVAYRGNGNGLLAGSHTLNYAVTSDNPGGCSNAGSPTGWDCRVIDFTAETGNFVSFHAPRNANDALQVAYYDATNHQLKYARRVGGNVYCNNFPLADIGWQCDAIETVDIGGFGVGLSMAVDANGNPAIAYYDQTDYANGVLKVARFVGSGGNCGIGAANGTWQCSVADRGLIPLVGVHNVGQNPSIGLSPDGRVHVSHYDATAKQLRITNERGAAPTLTKFYDKNSVGVGGIVQATYTIKNNLNNQYVPMTRVNFTDAISPTAIVQSVVSNTCGPVGPIHDAGDGSWLNNGIVPALGSCSIKLNLVAKTPGLNPGHSWAEFSVEAAGNSGVSPSLSIFLQIFLPLIRR